MRCLRLFSLVLLKYSNAAKKGIIIYVLHEPLEPRGGDKSRYKKFTRPDAW
jgi:hypothetical protein